MVRRWLWFGLRVGILLAIAVVVAKVARARRPAPLVTEPWDPITPRPVEPRADTAARVEPAVGAQIAAEPPSEVDADIEAEEDLEDDAVVEAGYLVAAGDAVAPDIADALTIERTAAPAGDAPPMGTAGAGATVAWVEPEDGACPASHPVKAKMGSRLFHLPGMVAYNRTRPDRCYTDADAAEADGFTRAKR